MLTPPCVAKDMQPALQCTCDFCRITITYIDKEGKEHTVSAPVGKNLLEIAHDNEIDLEGEELGVSCGHDYCGTVVQCNLCSQARGKAWQGQHQGTRGFTSNARPALTADPHHLS